MSYPWRMMPMGGTKFMAGGGGGFVFFSLLWLFTLCGAGLWSCRPSPPRVLAGDRSVLAGDKRYASTWLIFFDGR